MLSTDHHLPSVRHVSRGFLRTVYQDGKSQSVDAPACKYSALFSGVLYYGVMVGEYRIPETPGNLKHSPLSRFMHERCHSFDLACEL